MSALYMANGTHNHIDFNIGFPLATRFVESIAIGKQVKLDDLSDDDLTTILEHYAQYGLISSSDLGGAAPGTVISFVYSIDSPVADEDVTSSIEHNYPTMTYGMQGVFNRIKADGTQ